jgi:small subunit ribosomal protein S9
VKKTAKKTATKKKQATDYISAIGRRKTSVARVYIKRGQGQFLVNRKALNQKFTETSNQYHLILKPLLELDALDQFDVVVRVRGGGIAGQAGAIQLGLARALDRYELTDLGLASASHEEQLAMIESRPWRVALKKLGLLTRDARIIERKKFGLRKARKKEQYSKR